MSSRSIAFVATLAAVGIGCRITSAQSPGAAYVPPGDAGAMLMQATYSGAPAAQPVATTSFVPTSGTPYTMISNPSAMHVDDKDFADNDFAKMEPCDAKGGGKGGCMTCGDPCRRIDFYGEFLMLRPRDAEVAFAEAIDGPIVGPPTNFPVQISPVGVVDLDHQPAFRAGFRWHTDACTGVGLQYTRFEGSTSDRVEAAAPNVVRSLVSHPAVGSAARDWLLGTAEYDINFDILDAAYQRLFWCDPYTSMYFVAGGGYVQLEQLFDADFSINGTEQVQTDIDFYGFGFRIGLEADRCVTPGWLLYVKGYSSVVAGEFRADYDQTQSYNPVEVDTGWKAGRIVTIWDLEFGTSVIAPRDWIRLDLGYVFSAWTNMVQTDEWINGVRTNNFIDMSSTSTFDGLVARVELRY